MRIGFAGLGRMGRRMAANCAGAGYQLNLWNRSRGPAEELAATLPDARVVSDPAELASNSDVVITMLADDEAARRVYCGDDGLLSGQGASILVEMGTMSPALIAELAAAARKKDKRFLDAPVSGATEAARQAQLLIMAGGQQTDFEDLEPVFAAMGRKTIWLGATGHGAVMKLAVNMLIHGLNQTLAEALTLAARAGITESDAYDVIENSAAAAPMLKYRRAHYLDEAAQDVSFTVDLAAKDVGVALDLAARHGVAMPQTQATLSVLREAIAADFGQRDMASIFSFIKEKSE
ncbi:NAD(P)-dependent oxidoreductase [Pseudohoeflea coraliihabitans]|uniref:NAD(P)-dependent oxidoreductase n=1 Tax=Pseudohoeflea coraliihabitans TaxID=2860393 RepID=A0ABS6WV93_9HYPH|nr:NAD(P)-dependent oxidoreductase [Pseudohoeflea sp. DP4N28-3]MBW3099014.1 NAD(P)-dependent oxidoreductase [Pseudohoeflea sp. DP4N28-3]